MLLLLLLLLLSVISYQPASYLLSDQCTASKTDEICKSWLSVEFYNKVLCVLELMMIKKNIFSVPFVFK